MLLDPMVNSVFTLMYWQCLTRLMMPDSQEQSLHLAPTCRSPVFFPLLAAPSLSFWWVPPHFPGLTMYRCPRCGFSPDLHSLPRHSRRFIALIYMLKTSRFYISRPNLASELQTHWSSSLLNLSAWINLKRYFTGSKPNLWPTLLPPPGKPALPKAFNTRVSG